MPEPLRKALGEVNFLPDHAALGRVRAAQRRHAPPPEMTRELRTCARLLSHESGAVRLLAVQQLLGVLRGATSTALNAQLLSPHLTDREVSSLQPCAPGPRPRVPSLQPRVPSLLAYPGFLRAGQRPAARLPAAGGGEPIGLAARGACGHGRPRLAVPRRADRPRPAASPMHPGCDPMHPGYNPVPPGCNPAPLRCNPTSPGCNSVCMQASWAPSTLAASR
eukprot:scaffold64350_cov68-Phaeocystis_antarctica.AAC.7